MADDEPTTDRPRRDADERRSTPRRRVIVLLGAAVLAGALASAGVAALLLNISHRKSEGQNPYFRVVTLDESTVDPAVWGKNFPIQYDGYLRTVDQVRTRYGGYYLDAGCSQLIIDGEIGLLQYDRIERFVAGGAALKDGSVQPADLVVLATGFVPQEVVVRKLLGDEIARKVGPVWGFAADGEMNNMWRRTPQEGLWFVGGSFANCRTYSRYVAILIKAIEEGLLPKAG